MEDNTKQPLTADASLYNGQPTDTGPSCPSARLTSCAPSIFGDVRNGVSVGNALIEKRQWFVLRVSYGRIIKAKDFAEAKGLECYVPMRHKQIMKHSKKLIITEPLLPSFLFVHATRSQVGMLLCDCSNNTTDKKALLSFYYDRTSFREDAPDRNPPLSVSDSVMYNFIRLTSIKNPHIIPVTSENIKYKLGDEVVVTEGEFIGIHGKVARIAGQQRLVVELFDGCLVATAYIPKIAIDRI